MASVWDELKRRNVVRVALAYAVVSWLLLQLADVLVPLLGLPEWAGKLVFLLLAIGFPLALFFAWAFELTPEGIKREADVDRAHSVTRSTGRKLDFTIIGLMAIAIVFLIVDNYVLNEPEIEVTDAERSIAVLPFSAFSNDDSDIYFGKGVAEELLNALAQFPDLRVAARTSAFSFEGKDIDLREIGETLGVAHVLEGSVRRSGERLRITAQLIRTADGFHLWSETFERELTEIFAVQDEIVGELSRVLQFRLGIGAGAGRAPGKTTTPQAYEAYLKGLNLWWERDEMENRAAAVTTFQRVTELDPNFADGWAAYGASLALSDAVSWPHLTIEDYPVVVEAAIARALAIDSENARSLALLAYWHSRKAIDLVRAKAALERAIALAPNNPFVQYMEAVYARSVGDSARMASAMKRSLASDPLHLFKRRVEFSMAVSNGEYDPDHLYLRQTSDAIDVCYSEKTCTNFDYSRGFLLFFFAVSAGSQSDIAAAQVYWDKSFDGRDPAMPFADDDHHCQRTLFRVLLETEGEVSAEETPCLLDLSFVKNKEFPDLLSIGIAALLGHEELALEALSSARQLGDSDLSFVLSDGFWQMPESIRRHPLYHQWWARPGFAELAAARRANGAPYGLPLPVEESDDN